MKYPNIMNKPKKLTKEKIPGDIFHPGEYIKDELEAIAMSQHDLCEKTKLSKSEISLLLNGHRNITPNIAVLLENALGIDAEFWMNLQIKYDIDLIKKKAQKSIKHSKLSPMKKGKLTKLVAAA